jgi:glycerol-3-phosphate acyltransferase PlsX
LARIALDAMGGDFAPRATVAGALAALAEVGSEHTIQLVGQTDIIKRELEALLDGGAAGVPDARTRIEIIEAPDVIEMGEKPSSAVRGKPKSSMMVGLRLQAEGQSDGFVSAGSTGAQMAASTVLLRLHPGLTRPAIVTPFPTQREMVAVLDSGANVDCTAEELVQFARLGSVYVEQILGRTNPGVGLMSIGEEAEKGNAVTKEANRLLQSAGLNFLGNIEGRDLPKGSCDRGAIDVVVCDGFVGNIILKLYEAIGPMISAMLGKALGTDEDTLRDALRSLDYSEYGGAPLLGVRGVSIIAHGKSSSRAIKNAVRVALRAVETNMSDHIGRRLGDAGGGQA